MMMTPASHKRSNARSIAFSGLTVALLAVSAWITVPFGPVPFTLQTFVVIFALVALTPRECLTSLGVYLLLGAIGLPVFSGMRGGLAMLVGPTGGFLWGFLLAAIVVILALTALERSRGARSNEKQGTRREIITYGIAAALFMAIVYLCGWIQLMSVTGMGPLPAFFTAIAPFIVIDAAKAAFGVATGLAVKRSVRVKKTVVS